MATRSRTTRVAWIIRLLALACANTVSMAQWLNVQSFPVPTNVSQTIDITNGPDGALWFAEWNGDKIGRITTSGNITEYPLPISCGGLNCGPAGITAGPDGALWFVLGNANMIGRITTAGAFTMYPLPNFGGPRQIAAGPDGALWFTEAYDGNRIGRITTSGVITEYPLPTECSPFPGLPQCAPNGITAGPDGALWFTEFGGSKIGRITTSGVITEYPLPANSSPFRITTGPDGALWFTEANAGSIGRITTAGDITHFPVGTYPDGITLGPDGAFWFGATDRIGRMTTTGQVTLYTVPNVFSYGFTSGPDGAIWYTDWEDKIRRFLPCGLGLGASFAGSTLEMKFTLGVTVPAVFSGGFYTESGLNGLWSQSVPAIVPPVSFPVHWGPGFPSLGNIGVVSSLKDSTSGQYLCADWKIVDTGGSGASPARLERMIRQAFSK